MRSAANKVYFSKQKASNQTAQINPPPQMPQMPQMMPQPMAFGAQHPGQMSAPPMPPQFNAPPMIPPQAPPAPSRSNAPLQQPPKGIPVPLLKNPNPMAPPSSYSSLQAGASINNALKGKKVKLTSEKKAPPPRKIPSSGMQPSMAFPPPPPPLFPQHPPAFPNPPTANAFCNPPPLLPPNMPPPVANLNSGIPVLPSPPVFLPNLPPQNVDSNVAEICMEELGKDNALATGEPYFCEGCGSVLNKFSKLEPFENQQRWVCEFCQHENLLQLDEEEIPTDSKLIYVIESPIQAAQQKQGADDASSVIFCIDISGSMCVTSPVTGKFQLKTSRLDALKKEIGQLEGPQFLPHENKNVTYVSRLECLQAAIEQQLSELKAAAPHKHVGLVTFNNEVTVLGDGRASLALGGDKLHNWDTLLGSVAEIHPQVMGRNIEESSEELTSKVLGLQETGATALGPALLVSVGLAGQGMPGSKVILCTDGIANVGLGSLETEEEQERAEAFYKRIGDIAKEKGVAVSVISLTAEECCLEGLASLVDETGGELVKVDPANISTDFANILSQQILATNVEVTVNLHKNLVFRNQDATLLQNNGTRLKKNLGNVTDNSVFTFEYEVVSGDDLTQVPFQITVDHRKMNGMRCVLVDTQVLEVDDNQEEIIKNADFDLLARNARATTAQYANQGLYGQAVNNANMWQGYMASNAISPAQQMSAQNMASEVTPISYQLMSIKEEEERFPAKKKKIRSDQLNVGLHKLQRKR